MSQRWSFFQKSALCAKATVVRHITKAGFVRPNAVLWISIRAQSYHRGILVQSTGNMEDDFDLECMMETENLQKNRFIKLVSELRKEYPDLLPMSAGTCTLCKPCSYPDAPCRFPDMAFTSMEAYGLLVSDVCKKSGLNYYYGPQTITYTCCILLD